MEESPILAKIQKMLALAERGATDGERQNALLMAQRMMLEHGVEEKDVARQHFSEIPEINHEGEVDRSGRLAWWKKSLGSVISRNFKCVVYLKKRPEGKKFDTRLMFLGRRSDVHVATEVYYSACRFLEIGLKAYLAGLPKSRVASAKNTFISGYLNGIDAAYQAQVEKNNWSLMIVPPKTALDAVSGLKRDKQTGIKPKYSHDAADYGRGLSHGEDFVNRKVDGNGGW